MGSVVALVLGAVVVATTALSLSRSTAWWVRVWDYPRVQIAWLGLATLALWALVARPASALEGAGLALVVGATGYQIVRIWRYSRLAPREVQRSRRGDPARRISVVVCNVLQTNRRAERLVRVLLEADADVLLCVEADSWWRERLDALAASHPYAVRCALPNTYGMLLYSRLPLEETAVEFLVERDIPSIQARVRLRTGERAWLNCVHPRPPVPGESDDSLERDAELLVVGRRVRGAREPVIVCGDLNDVAWSRTTRLFQKVSRLLDPRKGRGLYSTFPARWPGFRWPLDHIFHSDDFRLVALRRLPFVGSDHFPVYASLSHEPRAAAEQEAPEAGADDLADARETIARGRAEAPLHQHRSVGP